MNSAVLSRPDAAKEARRAPVLDQALLDRIAGRAAAYDRDNAFFHEDLDELRSAGYLLLWLPEEFGGLGLDLPEVVREQSRLAYHAPATALAINMHLYWSGTATHLWKRGDHSTNWILEEIAAGKIFAAGHGEAGNDLGLAGSGTVAEPLADGAYRFTGRKVFTSLSPVWDWLGIHALDASDPGRPRIVHAFVNRNDAGHRSELTWDTHGVCATRSDDTVLDSVARDWAAGVDHGALWPAKLLAAKQHAVDGARRVVDLATDVVGASSLFRRNELERLTRDVRSGPFHPPNTVASHDVIGKSHLGVLTPG